MSQIKGEARIESYKITDGKVVFNLNLGIETYIVENQERQSTVHDSVSLSIDTLLAIAEEIKKIENEKSQSKK